MFEVITTGKNLNYGKKNEKRNLTDNLVLTAIKHKWIKGNVKYVGHTNILGKVSGGQVILPKSYINVKLVLEQQFQSMNRTFKEIKKTQKVFVKLRDLLEEQDG